MWSATACGCTPTSLAAIGVVYAEEAGDDQVEDEDDDERWLEVHCQGSRAGYRDMELLIDRLRDDPVADRLVRSIQGRELSAGSRTGC